MIAAIADQDSDHYEPRSFVRMLMSLVILKLEENLAREFEFELIERENLKERCVTDCVLTMLISDFKVSFFKFRRVSIKELGHCNWQNDSCLKLCSAKGAWKALDVWLICKIISFN